MTTARRWTVVAAPIIFGVIVLLAWQGAVVAATVVVFPLIYKSARAALELEVGLRRHEGDGRSVGNAGRSWGYRRCGLRCLQLR